MALRQGKANDKTPTTHRSHSPRVGSLTKVAMKNDHTDFDFQLKQNQLPQKAKTPTKTNDTERVHKKHRSTHKHKFDEMKTPNIEDFPQNEYADHRKKRRNRNRSEEAPRRKVRVMEDQFEKQDPLFFSRAKRAQSAPKDNINDSNNIPSKKRTKGRRPPPLLNSVSGLKAHNQISSTSKVRKNYASTGKNIKFESTRNESPNINKNSKTPTCKHFETPKVAKILNPTPEVVNKKSSHIRRMKKSPKPDRMDTPTKQVHIQKEAVQHLDRSSSDPGIQFLDSLRPPSPKSKRNKSTNSKHEIKDEAYPAILDFGTIKIEVITESSETEDPFLKEFKNKGSTKRVTPIKQIPPKLSPIINEDSITPPREIGPNEIVITRKNDFEVPKITIHPNDLNTIKTLDIESTEMGGNFRHHRAVPEFDSPKESDENLTITLTITETPRRKKKSHKKAPNLAFSPPALTNEEEAPPEIKGPLTRDQALKIFYSLHKNEISTPEEAELFVKKYTRKSKRRGC